MIVAANSIEEAIANSGIEIGQKAFGTSAITDVSATPVSDGLYQVNFECNVAPQAASCKSCRFFSIDFATLASSMLTGQCRRYAPMSGEFARINGNEWCGDYKERSQ